MITIDGLYATLRQNIAVLGEIIMGEKHHGGIAMGSQVSKLSKHELVGIPSWILRR